MADITRENILRLSNEFASSENKDADVGHNIGVLIQMLDAFDANVKVYDKNAGYSQEVLDFQLDEAQRLAIGEKEALTNIHSSTEISGLKKGVQQFQTNMKDKKKYSDKSHIYKLQRNNMVNEINKINAFFKDKNLSTHENFEEIQKLKKEWEDQSAFAAYNSYQLEEYYRNLKSVKERTAEFEKVIADILSGTVFDPEGAEFKYFSHTLAFLQNRLKNLEFQEQQVINSMALRIKAADYFEDIECDDVVAYLYDQLSQYSEKFPRKNRVKRNKPYYPPKPTNKTVESIANEKQKASTPEFELIGSAKEFTSFDADQFLKLVKKRQQEIIGLNQDLLDVQQMFKDMKKLVDIQQTGLDLIQASLARVLAEANEKYEFLMEAEKQQIAQLGDTFTDNIKVSMNALIDKLSAAWTLYGLGPNPVIPKPAESLPFVGAVYTAVSLGKDLLPANFKEISKMSLKGFLSAMKDIKSQIMDKLNEGVREEHRKKINKFHKDYRAVADPIRKKYFGEKAKTKPNLDAKADVPNPVKIPSKPKVDPELGFLRSDLNANNASLFYEHIARHRANATPDKSRDATWNGLNKTELFRKPENLQHLKLKGEAEIKLAGSASIWNTLNLLESDPFISNKKVSPLKLTDTREPYEVTHFKELLKNLKKAESEFTHIQKRVESGVFNIGDRSEYNLLQKTIADKIQLCRESLKAKKTHILQSAEAAANQLIGDLVQELNTKNNSAQPIKSIKASLDRLKKLMNVLEEKPENSQQPRTDPLPVLFRNLQGLLEIQSYPDMYIARNNVMEIISVFNPGGEMNDDQRIRLLISIERACKKYVRGNLNDGVNLAARILQSIPTEHRSQEDIEAVINSVTQLNSKAEHSLSLSTINIPAGNKKPALDLLIPKLLATNELKKDLIHGSQRVDFITEKQPIFIELNKYLIYLHATTGEKKKINYEKLDLEISFQIIDKIKKLILQEKFSSNKFKDSFKGFSGFFKGIRHDKTVKMHDLWMAQLLQVEKDVKEQEEKILDDLLHKSENLRPYITQNKRLIIGRVDEIRRFIESRNINPDSRNTALFKLDNLCSEIITENFQEVLNVELTAEKSIHADLDYLASIKSYFEKRNEAMKSITLNEKLKMSVSNYLKRYERSGTNNHYAPLFTLLGEPEWIAQFGKFRFDNQLKFKTFNFDATDQEFLSKNKDNAPLIQHFNTFCENLIRQKEIPWNPNAATLLEGFAIPENVYQYRINFLEQMLNQPNQHTLGDDTVSDQVDMFQESIGTRFPTPPIVDKNNNHLPSTTRFKHLFNTINHWSPVAETLVREYGDLEQLQRLHMLCAKAVLGIKGPKNKIEEELSLRQELWLRVKLNQYTTPESILHFFGKENLRSLYDYFKQYLSQFSGKDIAPFTEKTLESDMSKMEVAPERVVENIRQVGGNFNALLKLITSPEVTQAIGVESIISFTDVENKTAYLEAARNLNALTKLMHHDIRNRDARSLLLEFKAIDTTLSQSYAEREKNEQLLYNKKVSLAKTMWLNTLKRMAIQAKIVDNLEKYKSFLENWGDPTKDLPRDTEEALKIKAVPDLWSELLDAKRAYHGAIQNRKAKPFDYQANAKLVFSHFKIPILDSLNVNTGKLTQAKEFKKIADLLRSDFFTLKFHHCRELIAPALNLLNQKIKNNLELMSLTTSINDLLNADQLPDPAKANNIKVAASQLAKSPNTQTEELQNAIATLQQFAEFSEKLNSTYHDMSNMLNKTIESKYYELFSADIGKETNYEVERVINDLDLLSGNSHFPEVIKKINNRAEVYLANFERSQHSNNSYSKLFTIIFNYLSQPKLIAEYGRIRFQSLAEHGFEKMTSQDIAYLHDNENNKEFMQQFDLIARSLVAKNVRWNETAATYIEMYATAETIYLYRLKRIQEIMKDPQSSRELALADIKKLKSTARDHTGAFIPPDSLAGKSLAQTLKDLKHWTMGAEVLVSEWGTKEQLQDLHFHCAEFILTDKHIGQEELGIRNLLAEIKTTDELITFFGKENLRKVYDLMVKVVQTNLAKIREIKPLKLDRIDIDYNEVNVIPEEIEAVIRKAVTLGPLFDLFNEPKIISSLGLNQESELSPHELVTRKISRMLAERDLNVLTKHFVNTMYENFERGIKEFKDMDQVLLRSSVDITKDKFFIDSIKATWDSFIKMAENEVPANEKEDLRKRWSDPTTNLMLAPDKAIYEKLKAKLQARQLNLDLDEARRSYQLIQKEKKETPYDHNYKKDPSIIFTHYKIPMLQNLRVAMDYYNRTASYDDANQKIKELFKLALGSYLAYLTDTLLVLKKFSEQNPLSVDFHTHYSEIAILIDKIARHDPQIPTATEANKLKEHIVGIEKLGIKELKLQVNHLKNFAAVVSEIRQSRDYENQIYAVKQLKLIQVNLLLTINDPSLAEISRNYTEIENTLKTLSAEYADDFPEVILESLKSLKSELTKDFLGNIAITANMNRNIDNLMEDIQKNPQKYKLTLADSALYNKLLGMVENPSSNSVESLRKQVELTQLHRHFFANLGKSKDPGGWVQAISTFETLKNANLISPEEEKSFENEKTAFIKSMPTLVLAYAQKDTTSDHMNADLLIKHFEKDLMQQFNDYKFTYADLNKLWQFCMNRLLSGVAPMHTKKVYGQLLDIISQKAISPENLNTFKRMLALMPESQGDFKTHIDNDINRILTIDVLKSVDDYLMNRTPVDDADKLKKFHELALSFKISEPFNFDTEFTKHKKAVDPLNIPEEFNQRKVFGLMLIYQAAKLTSLTGNMKALQKMLDHVHADLYISKDKIKPAYFGNSFLGAGGTPTNYINALAHIKELSEKNQADVIKSWKPSVQEQAILGAGKAAHALGGGLQTVRFYK